MTSLPQPFPIEIISDVVCPWCYVGKKKLEMALAQLGNKIVPEIQWRPFQLSPEIPEEGINYKEHLVKKFGSERTLDGAWQRLTDLGSELGISFNFEKIAKAPNTLRLHSLVSQINDLKSQAEFVEILFSAHFSEGKDLTDLDTVWELAKPYFSDKNQFTFAFENLAAMEEIRKEITFYHKNGVSGVPYFILGNKYAVSGAQNVEVFIEVIETILREAQTAHS